MRCLPTFVRFVAGEVLNTVTEDGAEEHKHEWHTRRQRVEGTYRGNSREDGHTQEVDVCKAHKLEQYRQRQECQCIVLGRLDVVSIEAILKVSLTIVDKELSHVRLSWSCC